MGRRPELRFDYIQKNARFVRDRRRMAVRLHQQHGCTVGRQPHMGVFLHAARRRLIEKLESAGNDPGRDDRRHGLRRVLDTIVQRQHRLSSQRPRHELQENLGDDTEAALGANEEILHRVARHVLHALAAEPCDAAVWQHDFKSHDVVAGDAVLQPS